ncbi:AraC family transcriptional regulator [Brevundimonas intermedia]|uniref:AraC family transcriptional regulator n=1 Tax=Brevundimonas intermedia TaxID=74315 RepID=A0ABQ5T835_9CAUL|nr:AraC family transcriptional regulator [Brevundimonas intermedia]GLK48312.1 AraC family transcriptional regulator [Brevundimonas intermedia]
MITTVVSETGRHRLVLTHYAPDEECRAHRHSVSQISVLLVGAYEEVSAEGRRAVAGPSLSCKPQGFEHENRFGEHGALMLSLQGEDPAGPATSYFVTQLENRRAGTKVLDGAAGTGPWAHGLHGGRSMGLAAPPAINPGLQKARRRLLAEPDLSIAGLARSLDLHPVHVARLFRSTFGRSPAEMRREARAARAVDRIIRSPDALADIAVSEGFSDQAHMTRSVGEVSGWSPGALRRLLAT